jgi:RNA polymerase sigma-70 factor (ECF subfamily)
MDQSLAEDAVQHVFVKLWELHSHLEVSISIKNYLYTMTKNYVLNVIRNQKNVIAHNYAISQSGHINVYEDCLIEAIENKETIAHFYSAINKLPDQKKTVCLMKLEGRYSNQEIAEKMNISINTVKTHYAQSIKILKQHLEKILIFIYIILSS